MNRLAKGPSFWAAFTLAAVVLAFAGCAGHVEVPESSPFRGSTLPPYDALVRHNLLDPTTQGLELIREEAPDDDVVRLMNEGLFLHRMGRYEESNVALQRAEAIATSRYGLSLGQDLASLVLNDEVLDYQASALERSMIHYYGIMNYVALGDREGALTEARRANALLRRYANDFPNRSFVNDAAVQYLAGMLQWGQREENDAIVSLRQSLAGYEDYEVRYGVSAPVPIAVDAARIAQAVGLQDVAEETRTKYLLGRETEADEPGRSAVEGDVLLIVENGFIAHKRQQKLFMPILRSERDAVLAGNAGSAIEAAVRVLVRTVVVMNEMSRQGQAYVQEHEDGVTLVSGALSAVGVELITMAWPVYELDTRRADQVRVIGPDGRSLTPTLVEDLSAIAVRDFEERKTPMLLRMTARTLLKEVGVIQSERAGERAGGALGGFAARVAARAVANATERADTRSWSGLPAELLLTRLRLPAGEHEIEVAYEGIRGPERQTVRVDVRPGSVTLRSVAVVGRGGGDRNRFRQARTNVKYEVPPTKSRRAPG